MVLPAKIFEIKAEINIESIADKLRGFCEEESYETADGTIGNLMEQISDLQLREDAVSGVFSKDFLQTVVYKRSPVESPITEETPFWIRLFEGRTFLIISGPSGTAGGKKLLTNYVANRLGQLLFTGQSSVVETKITHATLKALHERNPEATKLIWFDQVDIPGVEKLCLAGSDLGETHLYHDYVKHGKLWYVVFEIKTRGIVVGITRKSVVTLFSKSTTDDFLSYIFEDLMRHIE